MIYGAISCLWGRRNVSAVNMIPLRLDLNPTLLAISDPLPGSHEAPNHQVFNLAKLEVLDAVSTSFIFITSYFQTVKSTTNAHAGQPDPRVSLAGLDLMVMTAWMVSLAFRDKIMPQKLQPQLHASIAQPGLKVEIENISFLAIIILNLNLLVQIH